MIFLFHMMKKPAKETKMLFRYYLRKNIDLAIVQAACETRRTVQFIPLHYSDLQPIELV